MENARRYWPVLKYLPDCAADDFYLANLGRQFWAGRHWLAVGRNVADNEALEKLARPGDFMFKTLDFPGPLSLGRPAPGADWDDAMQLAAAALTASFSPKAKQHDGPVRVRVARDETSREVVIPAGLTTEAAGENTPTDRRWRALTWEEVKPEIHALRKPQARAARTGKADLDVAGENSASPEPA